MVLISSITEAYGILELEQGATIDLVKASYKQLALRTHPDKNPDNPEATAKFQQVSAAYNLLSKHLNRSSEPGRGYDPYEDDYSDDDFDFYEEDEEGMDFFRYLFEVVMGGQGMGIRIIHRPPTPETEELYQERMRQNREAMQKDKERRARIEEERKAAALRQREREREEAEHRQKVKAEQRRASAAATRRNAEQTIRSKKEQEQTMRSAIFAAARRGEADKVQKGVWEDGVDAAGGEVKPGHEEFLKCSPKDPFETLLHIAASKGNLQLVEWLDAHNAEADERNAANFTAFHVAVQCGYAEIVRYFLDNYSPKDDDARSIYSTRTASVLRLAVESRKPEVVWLVLESKLPTKQEIADTWTYICQERKDEDQVQEEIQNLLMSFGGFTPPSTPKANAQDIQRKANRSKPRENKKIANDCGVNVVTQGPTPVPSPGPSHTSQRASQNPSNTPPQRHYTKSYYMSSAAEGTTDSSNPSPAQSNTRGRGRGRSRGRGRGGGQTLRAQTAVA